MIYATVRRGAGEIITVTSAPMIDVHSASGPESFVVPAPEFEGRAQDIWAHYWKDGALHARPEMPVQIANQTVTVPPSTEFSVRGPAELSGQADETGILEFEFDEPGEYTIELRCFPYLDKEITLHAD